MMGRLSQLIALVLVASSCTNVHTSPGFASSDAVVPIRKVEISASSSIFIIFDYVPGCLPNCDNPRTYRNWRCEIINFIPLRQSGRDASGAPFNVGGSSYNPWFDPAENCIHEFANLARRRAA